MYNVTNEDVRKSIVYMGERSIFLVQLEKMECGDWSGVYTHYYPHTGAVGVLSNITLVTLFAFKFLNNLNNPV